MRIYTDKNLHKDNTFGNRKDRDVEVKQLRKEGWIVKVGKYNDIDGSGEIHWYEATKERK